MVTQCTLGMLHCLPSAEVMYLGAPCTMVPFGQKVGGRGESCGQALASLVTQCDSAVVHSKPLPSSSNVVSDTSLPPVHEGGGTHAAACLVTQWTFGILHSLPSAEGMNFGGPLTTVPSLQKSGGKGESCGQAL